MWGLSFLTRVTPVEARSLNHQAAGKSGVFPMWVLAGLSLTLFVPELNLGGPVSRPLLPDPLGHSAGPLTQDLLPTWRAHLGSGSQLSLLDVDRGV